MQTLTIVVLLVVAQLSARDILNQGVRAYREGRYDAAIALFEEAVKTDPQSTVAEHYLARAYLQRFVPGSETEENRHFAEKAIERFNNILKREPANADAVAGLATIYQNSNQLGKAREFYLRNAELNPFNAVAFYQVAAIDWILAANRKPAELALPNERDMLIEEGLRYVDIALSLDPNFEDAMSYKNLLLREKAKWALDPNEKTRLIADADHWFNRALETRRNRQGSIARRQAEGFAPIPPPPPPPILPSRIRISAAVAQGNTIFRPEAAYPPEALQARIQGTVILEAVINKEGLVDSLRVISGHPLLIQEAVNNAKQWRFRPTLLNGIATEVVTTLTVDFRLQ